jgi:hypothetical protein
LYPARRPDTEKLKAEWKRVNADAARLLGKPINPQVPPWGAADVEYETYLNECLAASAVVIAPYPTVSHEDVVQRILAKQMPFQGGETGYRDYLIRHTILELVRKSPEEIAFITANMTLPPEPSPVA